MTRGSPSTLVQRDPGWAQKSWLLPGQCRQKMSFGSSLPSAEEAAGSRKSTEIRQPFICSTPACLEKYVISTLNRSFNGALRGFGVYSYFSLGVSGARTGPVRGSRAIDGGSGCLYKLADQLVSGEG